MAQKLAELAKTRPTLSSGRLMIGPNERARSQYPSRETNPGGGGLFS